MAGPHPSGNNRTVPGIAMPRRSRLIRVSLAISMVGIVGRHHVSIRSEHTNKPPWLAWCDIIASKPNSRCRHKHYSWRPGMPYNRLAMRPKFVPRHAKSRRYFACNCEEQFQTRAARALCKSTMIV